MPRTKITPQVAGSGGLAPNFEAANVDGNSFPLRPGRALRIKNTHTAAQNVALITPGTVDGLPIGDRTISVPATSGDVTIGLGRGDAYRQTDGQVHVDYPGGVTGLAAAVVDIP
jgi:hypothetical protein